MYRKPKIFRKRYIPLEIVDISSDEVIYRDEGELITRWNVIKPRKDFSNGVSYTFLKDGFKVGRFYDDQGKFLYWYCDIIDVVYEEEYDRYTLVDLLIDIKIMPDGKIRLLDADELADAAQKGLINLEEVCRALKKMDNLLKMIYSQDFPPVVCRDPKYW